MKRMLEKDQSEVFRYLFFGVCSMFLNFGCFRLCVMVMHYQAANLISWIITVLFVFLTNKFWVFKSEAKDTWKHELLRFTGARIATLIMEVLLMALFIEMLLWNEMFAKIIVQIDVVIMNYILSKYLVFRKGGE